MQSHGQHASMHVATSMSPPLQRQLQPLLAGAEHLNPANQAIFKSVLGSIKTQRLAVRHYEEASNVSL